MKFVFVHENQLDAWVNANERKAQETIPTLMNRLISATCPHASFRRFPAGDSIGQQGIDGFLSDRVGFPPFVPSGDSFWEIGTGLRTSKATEDYNKRTDETPIETREKTTFVYLSPRSGSKGSRFTKKKGGQIAWVDEMNKRGDWKRVEYVDATVLIDWIVEFPAVGKWLAKELHVVSTPHLETVDERWQVLQSLGAPHSLTPCLFLANRDNAIQKLKEVIAEDTNELRILTRFPSQLVDFVCAYIASLEKVEGERIASKALVVSSLDTWSIICEAYRKTNLILIADPALNLSGESGLIAIQKAATAGHSVIYDAPLGGPDDDLTQRLQDPRSNQIENALRSSGFSEERAHVFANRCNRNLNQLLRLIQGKTANPGWATGSGSTDLVVALLAGSWYNDSQLDQIIIQELAGKEYTEWTRIIREVVGLSNPPIIDQNGIWKFVSRFEGWYCLGPLVDRSHLKRFFKITTEIFRLGALRKEVVQEDYYHDAMTGGEIFLSPNLQKGLIESLALLGSHAKALKSLDERYVAKMTNQAIQDVLSSIDAGGWSKLSKLLPLFAEASPSGFLDAVQSALERADSPLEIPSYAEQNAFLESRFPFGLLWAIESVAWDQEMMPKACKLLINLSVSGLGKDTPNYPLKSLSRILFPLLPQTRASSQSRIDLIRNLANEYPDSTWNLLLDLFPGISNTVLRNYQPVWRENVLDDWTPQLPNNREYISQIEVLSELVVKMACNDFEKLSDERFIHLLSSLSPFAFETAIDFLSSKSVINLPDDQRINLWSNLARLHLRHKSSPDARWALSELEVLRIKRVVNRIAPREISTILRIAFSPDAFLLINETEDDDEEPQKLRILRQNAVRELLASHKVEEVIRFATVVEHPDYLGQTLTGFADDSLDQKVLPKYLNNDDEKLEEFVRNYVVHRLKSQGWEWVDRLGCPNWTSAQIGKLLGWLPFSSETWDRATNWLANDEAEYWRRTHATFSRNFEGESDVAIENLISIGRSQTAIESLANLLSLKKPFNHQLACKALLSETPPRLERHISIAYKYGQIVKELQSDSDTPIGTLLQVEWRHFDLFDSHLDVFPKTIEHQLSTDPVYFHKVVSTYVRLRSLVDEELKPFSQNEIDILQHSYFMFSSHWKKVPGFHTVEGFSPGTFEKWLNEVYRLCDTSELLEQAQQYIGDAILHFPEDPRGLWLHQVVAKAFNDTAAEPMRRSCFFALRNSRGVFEVEGTGAQERKLSLKYKEMAKQTREAGFHRLAGTLSDVAKAYDEEANSAINRDDLEA
ncbi:MAG: hypothetical protein OXG60_11995 [Chloroflexi bacterium]|nr:hypothetical protein [Chloroflexota bacterium]